MLWNYVLCNLFFGFLFLQNATNFVWHSCGFSIGSKLKIGFCGGWIFAIVVFLLCCVKMMGWNFVILVYSREILLSMTGFVCLIYVYEEEKES